MEKLIFLLGTWAVQKQMQKHFCSEFYTAFRQKSKSQFAVILAGTPDIGKSVFKLNFQFAPAYIAWYKALKELGLDQDTVIHWIWNINEAFFRLLPRTIMKRFGTRIYLRGFRKNAPRQQWRSEQNLTHEYDFLIRFHDIDKNSFSIDIYRCGIMKLCEKYDAKGLFPGICRIDYLISHYMGCGFSRNKTIGDGDDVCNCLYQIKGVCEWNPQKGFKDRK